MPGSLSESLTDYHEPHPLVFPFRESPQGEPLSLRGRVKERGKKKKEG
jgi:hypothetical protein